MKEALKITLPSALDANVNFLKLGELRIKITTRVANSVVRINFTTNNKATDLIISGGTGAYFCNQSGTTNLGTTATAVVGGNAIYFKPNGVFNLSFSNKFALTQFGNAILFSTPTSIYEASPAIYAEVDLKDLKYIDSLTRVYLTDVLNGDLSDVGTNITHFFANRTTDSPAKITGTLSPSAFNFSTLTELSLSSQGITGSVNGINFAAATRIGLLNCAVSGTLLKSNISTSLTHLDLTNTHVVMDFSVIEDVTNLTTLNLNNSLAFGDVSKLRNVNTQLGNLRGLNITGDIAQLNNNCYFISNVAFSLEPKNNNAHLSSTFYTNAKPDRTYILATESVRMVSGVDQFLIDMSNMNLHPNAVSGSSSLRTISIRGARTSASDAAVSALAGKGVTVIMS